jgi:hypothetical protein
MSASCRSSCRRSRSSLSRHGPLGPGWASARRLPLVVQSTSLVGVLRTRAGAPVTPGNCPSRTPRGSPARGPAAGRSASLSGARSWSLPPDLFCPRRCSGRGEARRSWRPSSVGGPGLGEQAGHEQPRHRPLRRGAPGGTIAVRMAQALGDLLAVLLIGYIAYAVWTGAWYGTWCASGRKPGQRIPGVRPPEPR